MSDTLVKKLDVTGTKHEIKDISLTPMKPSNIVVNPFRTADLAIGSRKRARADESDDLDQVRERSDVPHSQDNWELPDPDW